MLIAIGVLELSIVVINEFASDWSWQVFVTTTSPRTKIKEHFLRKKIFGEWRHRWRNRENLNRPQDRFWNSKRDVASCHAFNWFVVEEVAWPIASMSWGNVGGNKDKREKVGWEVFLSDLAIGPSDEDSLSRSRLTPLLESSSDEESDALFVNLASTRLCPYHLSRLATNM